jgi:DNA modification methylase
VISPGNHIQEPIVGDQKNAKDLRLFLVVAFKTAFSFGYPGATFYVAAPAVPLHIEFIGAMNDAGIPYRHQLVWVKNQFVLGRCDYHYKHEPILYGWKDDGPHQWHGDPGSNTVFNIDKPRKSDLHPTTKPIDLVKQMIGNSSQDGDIIFDGFLGSGTTIIASHRLGRICYGSEIEPKYADICLKRSEAEGLVCVKLEEAPQPFITVSAETPVEVIQDQDIIPLETV